MPFHAAWGGRERGAYCLRALIRSRGSARDIEERAAGPRCLPHPSTQESYMTDADPTMRYDGKAVVVTGSGRGLGRDYALLLASRGARVVVSDNGSAPTEGTGENRGPAEEVVAEIRAAGG